MKELNERLALLLFAGAATPFAAITAFNSGLPLAIGLSVIALMLLSFVAVLAVTEVMRSW